MKAEGQGRGVFRTVARVGSFHDDTLQYFGSQDKQNDNSDIKGTSIQVCRRVLMSVGTTKAISLVTNDVSAGDL